MSSVSRNFPERKLSITIFFQNIPLQLRVQCDAEWRCEHNIENRGENAEKINNQKVVPFIYFLHLDLEHILPSRCHNHFGGGCKEWFVIERQELKSNKYIFPNEINSDLQLGRRAEKKQNGKKIGHVEQN